MHSISTKELRTMMPTVRDQLKKGESFLLIHKSKPIAMLKPVQGLPTEEELNDGEFEAMAAKDFFDDDECLSDEDLQYYLSLKDNRK